MSFLLGMATDADTEPNELAAGGDEGISSVKGIPNIIPSPYPLDPQMKLIPACDASAYDVGGMLTHHKPDGSEQPIGYTSHTHCLPHRITIHNWRRRGWLACLE